MSQGATIVCRCEDVTLVELEAALAAGADTVNELKQWTRLGMGVCQGRTCLRVARAVAGGPLPRRRYPARPVPLGALQRELPPPRDDLMGLLELDLEAARDADG